MFDVNFQLSINIKSFNNALVNSFKLPSFFNRAKHFTNNDIWLDYLAKDSQQNDSLNNNIWKGKITIPNIAKITIDRDLLSSISYENLEWEDATFEEFIDSLTAVDKELPDQRSEQAPSCLDARSLAPVVGAGSHRFYGGVISDWDKLYVFGDSLSDTGNVLNLTQGQFPTFPYAKGRFSNGDIWVDYLSKKLDLNIELFTDDTSQGGGDSKNFAIGGATSGEENVGIVPFGLKQQINNFKLHSDRLERFDDDLFSVWIGANDYFSFIEDDPTTEEIETNFPNSDREIVSAVIEVVDLNIGNAVREIIEAGGKNIAIFNLPDIDKTPLAQNLMEKDRTILQKLSSLHNQYLSNFIEKTEFFNPDVNLLKIDVESLFDEILKKPHDFGFTNVADNYTGIDLYTGSYSSSAEGNPNEFLFFDSVHPVTNAQSLIADLVLTEIT